MNYPMWSITVLLALGTVAVTSEVTGQVDQFVEKSHVDSSGSAFTPDGKIKVALREVQIEVRGTKGPITLSVLVMRDPSSGAYSWRVHTAAPMNPSLRLEQFNDSQAAFLKNGEFTDFMALPTPLRLFVHQFSGRALNMNEAVDKSLKEASASLHPFGDVETAQGVHEVSLLAVGRDFTSNPMSVTVFDMMPRVSDVQWDGKHWTVTLKARWTEEIILDSDFKVISMREVGN
jgi:hypothetical protein